MQDVVFDSQQTLSGINKFRHYQFGSLSCVACKSDDTCKMRLTDITKLDGYVVGMENERDFYHCNVCNYVYNISK